MLDLEANLKQVSTASPQGLREIYERMNRAYHDETGKYLQRDPYSLFEDEELQRLDMERRIWRAAFLIQWFRHNGTQ